MKLFAWRPTDWGPSSFYVMAETREEAVAAVRAADPEYSLREAERGEVLTNDNG